MDHHQLAGIRSRTDLSSHQGHLLVLPCRSARVQHRTTGSNTQRKHTNTRSRPHTTPATGNHSSTSNQLRTTRSMQTPDNSCPCIQGSNLVCPIIRTSSISLTPLP
jgi:hypothetical protein